MTRARDYRDIYSGLLLMCMGGFATIYAALTLPLGTVMRMGPGGFPAVLGGILFLIGVIILVPALRREGEEMPSLEIRPAAAVLGAGIVFSLILERVGLVPATFALVIIAASGDIKLTIRAKLALGVILSALAFLIFKVGLSLPIVAVRWPF
jgi:hypothetical protein